MSRKTSWTISSLINRGTSAQAPVKTQSSLGSWQPLGITIAAEVAGKSSGAAAANPAPGGGASGAIDCAKCPDGYFMYSAQRPSCASGAAGAVTAATWSPDNDDRYAKCGSGGRCWKCPPAAGAGAAAAAAGQVCMTPATEKKPANCAPTKHSARIQVPGYDPNKTCWVCLRCPSGLRLDTEGKGTYSGCNPQTHHVEVMDNAYIVGATPEQNQTYVSDLGIRCLACKLGKG